MSIDKLLHPLHFGAVHELAVAAAGGDGERLRALLHPGVAVVVDRGDPAEPEIRVVRGVEDAALLLAHGLGCGAGVEVEERPVNAQPGLLVSRSGAPLASLAVDLTGSLVSLVWVRLNPVRLRRGNAV